jgi:hypothetical protein
MWNDGLSLLGLMENFALEIVLYLNEALGVCFRNDSFVALIELTLSELFFVEFEAYNLSSHS